MGPADTLLIRIHTGERVARRHAVHDKFHCAKELNKAVHLVRRREHRELQAQGIGVLTKTRYLWLKNPRNGTDCPHERSQAPKVDALKVGHPFAIKRAQIYWAHPLEFSKDQLKLLP